MGYVELHAMSRPGGHETVTRVTGEVAQTGPMQKKLFRVLEAAAKRDGHRIGGDPSGPFLWVQGKAKSRYYNASRFIHAPGAWALGVLQQAGSGGGARAPRASGPRSSGGAPRARRPKAEAFVEEPASAFAMVIDFGASPTTQTNVPLGSFATLAEATQHADRVGNALKQAAEAGGWAGGRSMVRLMVAHEGSHHVQSVKADPQKAITWLRAHGGKPAKSKPSSRGGGRPKAPKPAAAPRPAAARAARPAPPIGERGYYVWLEAKEPGTETSRKPISGHRLEREAVSALKKKLAAIMESPGRVPRKGRKIRLVVKNERNKLIAVIPWVAA